MSPGPLSRQDAEGHRDRCGRQDDRQRPQWEAGLSSNADTNSYSQNERGKAAEGPHERKPPPLVEPATTLANEDTDGDKSAFPASTGIGEAQTFHLEVLSGVVDGANLPVVEHNSVVRWRHGSGFVAALLALPSVDGAHGVSRARMAGRSARVYPYLTRSFGSRSRYKGRNLDELSAIYDEACRCSRELRRLGFVEEAERIEHAMLGSTSGEILTNLGFHIERTLTSDPSLSRGLQTRMWELLARIADVLRKAGQVTSHASGPLDQGVSEEAIRRAREPSWRLYPVGFLLAGLAGYGLCSLWIGPQASLLAGGIAGLAGVIGVFMNETLIEAIVVTVIIGALVALLPKTYWIVLLGVPWGVGISVGKLSVGVWRECR